MKELFYDEKGIYYRINEFDQAKKTLVFIHGLTGSSSSWTEYEKRFESGYNILNIDLRGHGVSKKYKKYSDYAISEFSEDLHDLIIFLKIEKFIIISHSFGTIVSFEFLKKYPNLVEKAILLGADYYPKRRFSSRLASSILSVWRSFDFLPFNPKTGSHTDYSKFMNTYDFDFKRIFVDISNTTLRVYRYCLAQSLNTNYESLLPKIETPILLLHGKKDRFFPVSSSIFISEKAPNSKLLLYEGDHFVLFRELERVVLEIRQFVSSV